MRLDGGDRDAFVPRFMDFNETCEDAGLVSSATHGGDQGGSEGPVAPSRSEYQSEADCLTPCLEQLDTLMQEPPLHLPLEPAPRATLTRPSQARRMKQNRGSFVGDIDSI